MVEVPERQNAERQITASEDRARGADRAVPATDHDNVKLAFPRRRFEKLQIAPTAKSRITRHYREGNARPGDPFRDRRRCCDPG